MDPKTAPLNPVQTVEPTKPFLGNRILLLLNVGILLVLISIGLLYSTLAPQQKQRPKSTASPTHTSKPSQSYIQEGDQTIFAIGGYYKDKATKTTPATNSAEFYDFFIGKWQFAPPMHESHAAAATTVYDGKIYVFGGQSGNVYGGTTTVEMFDPTTNTWTVMSPMLHPRFFAQAVTVGTKIYVLGGLDTTDPEDKSMDIYSPLTNTWQPGPTIPMDDIEYTTPRCTTFQNKIYCPGLGEHAYTLVYDPATNLWQSLPTENRLSTLNFVWTTTDSAAYGLRFTQGNVLYQYEPAIDTITTTKTGNYIDKTYQGFRSVAFWDYMFLIGGKFSGDPVRDMYVLNLQHPTSWQKTSPLNLGRSEPGVVILPSLYSIPTPTPSSTPSAIPTKL